MQRLSEIFNVNTFIVSQVNPFVIPFINDDGGGILGTQSSFIKKLKTVAGNEAIHWINQLSSIGIIPDKLRRVIGLLNQTYKGNVTISPQVRLSDYLNILRNPTPTFIKDACRYSELNTYNKIALIRSVYEIEREINDCFQSIQQSAYIDDEMVSKVSYDYACLDPKENGHKLLTPQGDKANGKSIKKSRSQVRELNLLGKFNKEDSEHGSRSSRNSRKREMEKPIPSLNPGDRSKG